MTPSFQRGGGWNVRRATLDVLLAVTALLPVHAATGDRHPIAIRNPPPETPLETAGTGLGPAVSVRVTIDERGSVRRVEVLDVQPRSEFDDLFRRTVEETLRGWRYAPEIAGGQAVETTLQWTVQFPARGEADEEQSGLPALVWRTASNAESETADLQRKLLSMQLEQRAKHLEAIARTAQGFMKEESKRAAKSSRFLVYCDAPTEGLAGVAASNLEALFNVLGEMIGQDVKPQVEPYRMVAFVYASESGFNRLRSSMRGLEWAAGFYYPAGLLAFHLQMPSNESLLSVMLHEGTHAYLDRYVSRPGVVLPRWMHEGFAEYVGNSAIKDGTLLPGKTRKSETYRGPWGAVRGKAQVRFSIAELKTKIRKGEAVSLEQMIDASPEEFYGEQREMYYTMGWLVVHYLRHGGDGWDRERFPTLLLYMAEGYPADLVFREVYGDPAAMEPDFREYVRRF